MTEPQAHGGHRECPYPVREFNNATTGPVLSHAEEIDPLRDEYPFMRSTFANGFWVMAGAEMLRDALQQPETFSSTVVTVLDSDPPYKWIPEMLDPPEHTVWRQLLAPHFAPRAMERLEDKVRGAVDVTPVRRTGSLRLPARLRMAVPHDDLHGADGPASRGPGPVPGVGAPDTAPVDRRDPEQAQTQAFEGMLAVMGYFTGLIEEKRANPSDDLFSSSLRWTIDEKPIPLEDLLSWCLLMFMAGLDTVSIQLDYAFWHLAGHPEDWARIARGPFGDPVSGGGVPPLLRLRGPARKVMQDTDFTGAHSRRATWSSCR